MLPMSTPDKKGNSHQLEYQDQRSIDVVCIDGEDEGVVVEYKQSSVGAMKLFGKMINSLLDQIDKGDEIVPVGKWKFSTYPHTKYGEIYNPEFEIVEWRTPEDTSPVEDKPAAAPVKGEAPARTRTRAAAPEPEPEAEQQDAEADDLTRVYQAEELKAAATAGDTAAPRRRQRR